MEAILSTFGIDAKLITIQIINFGLLLLALWYFLYTPLLKLLNERQTKIEKGVKDAAESEKRLAEAEGEKQSIVGAAHKEAEDIVSRAKNAADEKGSEILKTAESKSEKVLSDAAIKAEEMKRQALKEHEAEVAKLAVLAAEKVLRERG